MTQQTQSAKPKPQTPNPYVETAARVQAQIDADRQEEAREAEKPAPRRGLPPDLQRLTKLIRLLDEMDPTEQLRAIEFIENRYRSGLQYEARPSGNGEG